MIKRNLVQIRVHINESELPWNNTADGSLFIFYTFQKSLSNLLHDFSEIKKSILKDGAIL